MASIRLVLFDFDGTVSDSHDAAIETYNSLSSKFGFRRVQSEELPMLREKTTLEILKHLKISKIKLPFVMKEARIRFQTRIEELKPIHGIRSSLNRLKEEGYELGILTSNSKTNVQAFLLNNEMEVFDFVYSGASIFGKGKMLKNLMKRHKLKPCEVVYVGDETRDIEAAKNAGIQMISVSWGFNTKQILKSQKPDFLIDHPSELLHVLNQTSSE